MELDTGSVTGNDALDIYESFMWAIQGSLITAMRTAFLLPQTVLCCVFAGLQITLLSPRNFFVAVEDVKFEFQHWHSGLFHSDPSACYSL